MTDKIVILGRRGQVGSALVSLLHERAIAADMKRMDLSRDDVADQLDALVGDEPITALINTAAYTSVDKAESEEELARKINATSVGKIAHWCKKRGVKLVHYSTDYVFDGTGMHARHEEEETAPLNVYGTTKLEGEQLVAESGADYLIFRTSWVYDAGEKNFPATMRRLFKERETISVVDDQIGAPTYAPDLAQATLHALVSAQAAPVFPSGIYHLCHSGQTSWHDFAKAIFILASSHESGIKCRHINPIPTTDYPTPARRPLNSRLDCSKAEHELSVTLPDWQEGLKRWAEKTYEGH